MRSTQIVPFFIALSCLFLIPSLQYGQNTENLERRTELLEEYYLKSFTSEDTLKYRALFFESFPQNFEDLQAIYGKSNGEYGPLVYKAYDHIAGLFNQLESIDEIVYAQRVINIAIDAQWDADAVTHFQNGLRRNLIDNPDLFCDLLSNEDDQRIQQFFEFFFDSIHPVWKEIPKSLESMREDERVCQNMEHAFIKVKTKRSGHLDHK